MDYHIFREFADSWMLLFMVAMFVIAILWAFRPGARKSQADSAAIPFRHEDHPATAPSGLAKRELDQ
ncbi:cbb3-type cytochrome c oxidase subunit 3 [Thioclava sp. GXIMD2076]|uniref:Cbb3-type cytochrome c oxidase subunit 3 n=1 Tax=Thioclava kandeliae TaxID=3070818 RepID=A0ABV1SED7_9RHOB